MALPLSLGDKASLENFWVGHNTEVVSAIQEFIQKGEPKILYLYGPAGAGKTHLLFAALRYADEQILGNSYLSLSNQSVQASMLESIDGRHLVALDDLHCWAGKPDMETAIFSLFENVKVNGGQMIASSTQPPAESAIQLTDLVSRLGSGLVYPVQALTDEQMYEAVKLRAQCRGLSIKEDAIRYLLSRTSRDPRDLFRFLDEVDRTSLVEKRRITIPFLQSVLGRQ